MLYFFVTALALLLSRSIHVLLSRRAIASFSSDAIMQISPLSSLLAVLIDFLVGSVLLMCQLIIVVISPGVFPSNALLTASSCSFTTISFALLYLY